MADVKFVVRGEPSAEAEFVWRMLSEGVLIAPNFGVFLDGDSISSSESKSSGLRAVADSGRVRGGRGTGPKWLPGTDRI